MFTREIFGTSKSILTKCLDVDAGLLVLVPMWIQNQSMMFQMKIRNLMDYPNGLAPTLTLILRVTCLFVFFSFSLDGLNLATAFDLLMVPQNSESCLGMTMKLVRQAGERLVMLGAPSPE